MQVAIKAKYPKFDDITLLDMAKEAARLDVIGIKTKPSESKYEINILNSTNNISSTTDEITDHIVEKVMQKMTTIYSIYQDGTQPFTNLPTSEQVNYAGSINSWIRPNNFRGKNYYWGKGYSRGRNPVTVSKCWCCNSTDHFIKACPMRFCQACGGKGHDSWSPTCAKKL